MSGEAPRVGQQRRKDSREIPQVTLSSGEKSGDPTRPVAAVGSPEALARLVERIGSLPPEALTAFQAVLDALAPPRGS